MRRSIRKRSRTRDPTKAPSHFAADGRPPARRIARLRALLTSTAPEFILSRPPTSLESHFLEDSAASARRAAGAGRPVVPNASRSCCGARSRSARGLIVLILIVLGVKGCLDARAHRALSDYARNVTQIVKETEQTSKGFFGKLSDPGQPLGDRVQRRGQRRPQRDGQLRLAGRRPRAPPATWATRRTRWS